MPLATSKQFTDALARLARQELLPTSAGTFELSQLPADIRERAMFSARVMDAQFLQRAHDLITRGVGAGARDANGNYVPGSGVNMATFRADMKEYLRATDYAPDSGKEGGLQDLSSDRRLNLIYETNVQLAQGYGGHLLDSSPAALQAAPAQELYRLEDRRQRRAWGQIWNDAIAELGDTTTAIPADLPYADDQMFALKNDPVWRQISRFDLPYPPFDFGSGMWVRDVDYATAVELGLLDAGEEPEPGPLQGFNDGLQVDVTDFADGLQTALSSFGEIINGVFFPQK